MRLYQQLILFMLAATVLPSAVVGFWLLSSAERELVDRIGGEQRALAEASAESAANALLNAVNAVQRQAQVFDWSTASPEEMEGGLRLFYRQSPMISAVVLLDAKGRRTAGPLFGGETDEHHPGFSPEGLDALVHAIPVSSLRQGGRGRTALSAGYPHSQGQMAALAVGVRLTSDDASSFVVAELGLGALSDYLKGHALPGAGRIQLVDDDGRVLASSDVAPPLGRLEPALWQAVQDNLQGARSLSFPVMLRERMLASAARVPGALGGLFAVVSVEERIALASVRAMRRTVLVSIGGALVVLLVVGGLFTRRVNNRLAGVVEGAEAFARGELGKRILVEGADELADLSETFNRMGGELEAGRERLQRWNTDLKTKVDEATAELRSAQAQLVETQKLAAVGQLGAGVAHEINNPLAGILGNTQLLLLDRNERDPDFDTLRKIEQSAKRCKEITQNLLRFSQQRERAELRTLDLNAVARDALSLTMSQMKGEGIILVAKLQAGPLSARGDPGHLSQVLLALLSNARTAMLKSKVKELKITTWADPTMAVVEVGDSGKGIKPEHLGRIFEPFFTTKDVWSNVGLGLSVAYRVVSEHHGKLEVATEVGKGTTFTLRIPRAG